MELEKKEVERLLNLIKNPEIQVSINCRFQHLINTIKKKLK